MFENLEIGETLGDIPCSEFLLATDSYGYHLAVDILDHPLEADLLQVQDDVDDILDNSGNGVELVSDTLDFYRGDGKSFQ